MSKATRRFIVNKILEMLITLVAVTLISFLLVRLSPIDPAEAYARRSFAAFSFTDEQMKEHIREIADVELGNYRKLYLKNREVENLVGIGENIPLVIAEAGGPKLTGQAMPAEEVLEAFRKFRKRILHF